MPVTWPNSVNSGSAKGSANFTGDAFHGRTSLQINYASGNGLVGKGNRGLGNEGLTFQAGKDYDGYLFVKSAGPVTVTVQLTDYEANQVHFCLSVCLSVCLSG